MRFLFRDFPIEAAYFMRWDFQVGVNIIIYFYAFHPQTQLLLSYAPPLMKVFRAPSVLLIWIWFHGDDARLPQPRLWALLPAIYYQPILFILYLIPIEQPSIQYFIIEPAYVLILSNHSNSLYPAHFWPNYSKHPNIFIPSRLSNSWLGAIIIRYVWSRATTLQSI